MKGEKRMKKLTYQAQTRLSIGSLVLCFLMAHITKQGAFTNVGWIITGLLFIINPVWPKMWDWKDPKYLKLGSRVGGILAVAIGLMTRFYP